MLMERALIAGDWEKLPTVPNKVGHEIRIKLA